MGDIDLSQFRALYGQTALEYLKNLEDGVKILRQNPQDKETVNTMYIAAHSLKSQSVLMGYTSLGTVALTMERTFHSLKDSLEPVSEEIVAAVETVVHAVRDSLVEVNSGRPEKDMSQILKNFKSELGLLN